MISYNIISTGSEGNAVILEDSVLIDCGVSFKALKPHYQRLKLVLLTHIHSDHFRKNTIKNLAKYRPGLRFGCGEWLVADLVACGVPVSNIDVLSDGKQYGYGICTVQPVPLVHNVPNQGYKVHFPHGKVIYATDTNNLNGIEAKNYDLYLIEANYGDEEIQDRIKAKTERGEYAYEQQVLLNHLSKAKANDFIYKNIGANGAYVYMHEHKERDKHHDNNNSEGGSIRREIQHSDVGANGADTARATAETGTDG